MLAKFAPKAGSWQCLVCMVQNPDPNASNCVSCESPNPNAPKTSNKPDGQANSFGSFGGFGTSQSSDNKQTFSFGFNPTSNTTQSTGFSFSAPTSTSSGTGTTTGFSFGIGSTANAAQSTDFGFSAPANSNTTTGSTTGFSFCVAPKEDKAVPKSDYGKDTDNVFNEDDESDDEEEERKEEREKASKAFDKVDVDGHGNIPASSFEKLFKALGTVYCEEEHSHTLKKLHKDGKIFKDSFVQWYESWIFDDNEEDVSDTEEVQEEKVIMSPERIKAALAKFTPAAGSWQCNVCMVQNSDSKAPSCVSCEAPNPNAPKKASSVTASTSSGFTFGFSGTPTSAPSPPVTFGFTSDTKSSPVAAFGSNSTSKGTKATGFSFGITPSSTATTDKEKFGTNTDNVFNEDDEDDGEIDEGEYEEEREKASAAFDEVDSGGSGCIPVALFEKIFKALGTVYCEEEHVHTLKKLNRDGLIYKDDFIRWYLEWIFGDSGSESSVEATSEVKSMKSPEEIKAAMARFTPVAGSWQCKVCMVQNPKADASRCVSCDSPNPGKSSSAPTNKSTGGFSFPTATLPSTSTLSKDTSKPSFGFGASTNSTATLPTINFGAGNALPFTTSKGFSFGKPSESNQTASTDKPTGFTFPASSKSTSAYPPDTSSKPAATPAFTAPAKNSSAYPPDTSSKPAATPAFPTPAKTSSAYPPDTSSKPAATPAFSFPAKSSSAYPPDTSTKPAATPAFSFPTKSTSAYPPDTSSKPAATPAFGTPAKSSSSYPPDTSSKPAATPAFGTPAKSTSAYPPDTSSKPAATPAFGTPAKSSSAYPPDTSAKPVATPAFNFSTKSSSVYPPDTSSKAAPAFSLTPSSKGAATPAFGTPAKSTLVYPPDTSSKPAATPAFGTPVRTTTPSPSMNGTATPLSGFSFPSKTAKSVDVNSGSVKSATKSTIPKSGATKVLPSSEAEGEIWSLINNFDKTLQTIRSEAEACEKAPSSESDFTKSLKTLRGKIIQICDTVDALEGSYQSHENNIQAVVGNSSDVQAQIECAKGLLATLEDKTLMAQLEDQPLDQRSATMRDKLKKQIEDINRFTVELDKHIRLLKEPGSSTETNSSAQLFRVLKLNYETSKREYNRALQLAEKMKELTVTAKSQAIIKAPVHKIVPSKELVRQLREEDEGVQKLRSVFGLPQQTIAPRDISSSIRRQPLRRETLTTKPEPVPEVVPKTRRSQLLSSSKTTIPTASKGGSLSFQQAPKPKEEPIAIPAPSGAQTKAAEVKSAESKPVKVASSGFSFGSNAPKVDATKSPARKPLSLGSLSFGDSSETVESPRVRKMSTASNGSKTPQKQTPISFNFATPKQATLKTENAIDVKSPVLSSVQKKPEDKPKIEPFKLNPTSSINYLERMKQFYEKHGNGKVISQAVMEKNLKENKDKEADLFLRLLKKYISQEATIDHAKEYLSTGTVPAALLAKTTPSASSFVSTTSSNTVFRSAAAQSPSFSFAKPPASPGKVSPFGGAATQSPAAIPFGQPSVTTPSPFQQTTPASSSPFGPPTTSSSPFGQPASTPAASPFGGGAKDYRTRLVEFYTKHNPTKLSDVDTVLAKYRGNEEKLFKNLEAKYEGKTNTPFGAGTTTIGFGNASSGTGFGQPSAPAATPAFGASNAFGASTPAFGSTAPLATSAFGSSNTMSSSAAPTFGSATPLGAAATTAFGATSSLGGTATPAFGSASSLGGASTFGNPSGFGSTAAPAAAGGGFAGFATTSAPSFGSFGGQPATGSVGQQSTGFGGQQSTGFGGQQSTGFGGQQSTGFGGQQSSGFGSSSGATFGSTSSFGQTSAFSGSSFTKMR
ncbi:nuclear pore complex protein [Thraustotheca clavata]|uniref:Nuclear pore complex protein n=1 Tax=Thraustotheca clavata TaxID=74557 RepID=A0A1V9Y5D1_9STRA|nr:nuclear pore complex protein [Thraustotheca clavata]